jgi:hypothetical protein
MNQEHTSRRMATQKEETFFFDEHNTKILANFDVVAVSYLGQPALFLKFRYAEEPDAMQDKDLKEISFIMPERGAPHLASLVLAAAQQL